jgi:uncharacterized Zn finger protein (UPF0148 family)
MENKELELRQGARLRTGSVTYEVTRDATVDALVVPVTPQGTRLLKVFCSTCGYTARVTKRWIDKAGTPICPTCHKPMDVAVTAEKPKDKKPLVIPTPEPIAPVYEPKPIPEPLDEPEDLNSVLEKLLDELPQ